VGVASKKKRSRGLSSLGGPSEIRQHDELRCQEGEAIALAVAGEGPPRCRGKSVEWAARWGGSVAGRSQEEGAETARGASDRCVTGRNPMTIIGSRVALVTGAWFAASLPASAAGVEVTNYSVTKEFDGAHATNLSGIACVPLNQGGFRCLVIDDESKFAQLAKIEDSTIEAKAKIQLIKKEDDPRPLGKKPSVDCPNGMGDFAELDGEGVAYAPPYFYVVGSHGCSRNSGKFRLSSFILARIRVDDKGRPVDVDGNVLDKDDMEKAVVETTYRVSDLLRRADTVGEYFGKSLSANDNGLNIEGIAVSGDRVFFGLRAPVDGMAYIVEGSVSALFAPGHDPLPERPIQVPIPVPMGNKVGIRDLALLSDDKLLILAGAAYQPDMPYSIFLLDLKEKATTELVTQRQDQPVRAEGITVLSAMPQEIRVLILFDGALDGAPQELRIQLSQ